MCLKALKFRPACANKSPAPKPPNPPNPSQRTGKCNFSLAEYFIFWFHFGDLDPGRRSLFEFLFTVFWTAAAAEAAASSKMKTKCNKRLRLKAATKNQRPEISSCSERSRICSVSRFQFPNWDSRLAKAEQTFPIEI